VTAVATPPSGLAHAHAELVDTEPANGAQLGSSPDSIVLRFTELVEALDGAIELLDSNGADVEIGDAVSDATTVSATLPLLADGGYVVNWQVVSSDGHPIAGAITFAVGEATPPAQPDGAGTSAGDNRIEVTAVGPDGGTPADDIDLRLTNTDAGVGTLEIDTVPAGAGTEVADLAVIPYAGRWTATIEARFGEFDVAEFTVELDID
jgi:methionine-rich copper-binding protein CopC